MPYGRLAVPNSDGHAHPYDIELTDEALYALASIPSDRIYTRVGDLIDMLAAFPRYGQVYDPYYRAAEPPVACRVLFCGSYGIYYHIDEDKRLVTVLAIEDERRNPLGRFKSVD